MGETGDWRIVSSSFAGIGGVSKMLEDQAENNFRFLSEPWASRARRKPFALGTERVSPTVLVKMRFECYPEPFPN